MMICIIHNQGRGFGMLGLVGLIALLATLTAAVSISSTRSAHGSIRGVERLQVQAAAEGAAVLLSTEEGATSSTLEIGDCVVDVTFAPDSATNATTVSLESTLLVKGRPRYSRSYQAIIQPGNLRLEPVS